MEQEVLGTPSCSLTIEHQPNYLHALASGKRESLETCRQIWKQIINETESKNHKKILFERKVEGIGTVSELQELITHLSIVLEGFYIAYVDAFTDHFQMNRMAELIAANHDLQVKFCTSVGEAKEWLLLK